MVEKQGILFAGDFCPQGRIAELIARKKLSEVFTDVLPLLHQCEKVVVDLECPFSDRGSPIVKTGPNLRCSPEAIDALRFANVHAVALANNHILDFGSDALDDTIATCHGAGIQVFGAGKNLAAARKPLVLSVGGIKIALYNLTENEWCCAKNTVAGANPLEHPVNFKDISEARKIAQKVIVIYHGGNEHYPLPSPRLKSLFRYFVDIGASAVIAHHSHVISGYEVYENAPIFYGLGNFCFDWPGRLDRGWTTGMAVRLDPCELTKFELIPFRQNDETPGLRLLSNDETMNFNLQLLELNSIIKNDHLLQTYFDDFCKQHLKSFDIYLEPYRRGVLAALRKKGLLPRTLNCRKRRWLLNLTRCESLRDVLLNYLDRDTKP